MNFDDCFRYFDTEYIVSGLTATGGVAVPLLTEPARLQLLAEAAQLTFMQRPEVVGAYGVRQHLSAVDTFPPENLFLSARDALQRHLTDSFRRLPVPPVPLPLIFDDLVLQQYKPGPVGISPHRDGKHFVYLGVILVLCGEARFCLCADRSGGNPMELDAAPGTAILLCAPGFQGSNHRPFHFVADIREPRITFGLRQRR